MSEKTKKNVKVAILATIYLIGCYVGGYILGKKAEKILEEE